MSPPHFSSIGLCLASRRRQAASRRPWVDEGGSAMTTERSARLLAFALCRRSLERGHRNSLTSLFDFTSELKGERLKNLKDVRQGYGLSCQIVTEKS